MSGAVVAEPSASRRAVAFRAALDGATLLLLGLSWPLWVGSGGLFPRVPFVAGLPEPSWWRASLFGLLVGSIVAGVVWRRLLLVGLPALAVLIAGDQHRLQPWAYQYGLMALAIGALPAGRALGCCRLLLIALYVHSGLSKLDRTFTVEVGPVFLAELLGPVGIDPWRWPEGFRRAASLLMPIGELLVGVGLAIRASRPFAAAGAVLMHGALIGILGPWGLDHSGGVVGWNASLIIEVLILFGRFHGPLLDRRPTRREAPVVGVFVLAALLPLLERRGGWDSWPSFALYASHAERVYVEVYHSDAAAYPAAIRRHLEPPRPGDPWRRLDLTAWSRDERGTPPYPQARAAVGVAESLTDRPEATYPVRVIAWGRADRFSGRRPRVVAVGREAIRRLADGYAINAHPAPRD